MKVKGFFISQLIIIYKQQIASYIIALPRNYLINVISETDIFSTHHNWVQVEQSKIMNKKKTKLPKIKNHEM